MARPPKPAALKQRAGNPGKRPAARAAAVPEALDALAPEGATGFAPPATLTAPARAVWLQEVPRLHQGGLLKATDLSAVAVYCEALARYRKATAVVARKGHTYETATGYVRPRPEVGIAERAERTILAFQRALALTTESRVATAHRLSSARQYTLPGLSDAPAPAPDPDPVVGYLN